MDQKIRGCSQIPFLLQDGTLFCHFPTESIPLFYASQHVWLHPKIKHPCMIFFHRSWITMLYFNRNLNILNPFKAATVMPPNALNSTLIAKYKVFLWVDSAQTVLTTCQSTSELKQHTLPAFVSQKSKDTWLKIPGILKVLCCKFSSKHNWSSTFKGGSHILETFSLQMIQGMRATEPAFKSKPIKTESKTGRFPFSRCNQDTHPPSQSTQWVSESTEFSDWEGLLDKITKLSELWQKAEKLLAW